ncbi:ribonuclease P protein subunit p25-like protein isoform X2 [Monomorium pharaonis]|nr:ribonuclease P protein subunit p25-like protein isoform X2 [Monomorium pharaonis]XP_028047548.1 ribonuclease P protein subunit p25-like protein isoform X2 [Monomorium pharaonis]
MGKSKLKKKLQQGKATVKETEKSTEPTVPTVPIDNLPEKFLWMHVKSGTKIRNILSYALKEFSNHDSIVWTGIGHGIGKAISCAEIFKRKHEDLHQVTKLRYISSEKSKQDVATETHQIPEIHILLTKNIKDTTELGYQAPGDCGTFPKKEDQQAESTTNIAKENTDNVPCSNRPTQKMEKTYKRKKLDKSKKNEEQPSKKKKVQES